MTNKTVLITEVTDSIHGKREFMSPSLTDAAGGVANLTLMAVLGGGAVDMPEVMVVKVYKVQMEETGNEDKALLTHTKVKLAEVEVRAIKERYPGVPINTEEEKALVETVPMVTLQ